jgi:hypothetical protein
MYFSQRQSKSSTTTCQVAHVLLISQMTGWSSKGGRFGVRNYDFGEFYCEAFEFAFFGVRIMNLGLLVVEVFDCG